MAEVHIIGQILRAEDFEESHLFCKWSLQCGSAWKVVQGRTEGSTFVCSNPLEKSSEFCCPLDIHLATGSVQGWPKLHLEIYAVNFLKNTWPVGFGVVYIPMRPGFHRIEVDTWKVAPVTFWDCVRERFGAGGTTLSKEDLIFSGAERYKLQTKSSGSVVIEISLIFRKFSKYGVEFV
ncbi:B9 domain-containing protein 2 [Eupeodes corollae]|uniref:B9 domain-containing protein 2 n=1 Tax=Eupeodes corollae TaxID=290404 RepID=UPI00249148F1|nr:B9 domain-containing protein 2 [Eupeodes corollae]